MNNLKSLCSFYFSDTSGQNMVEGVKDFFLFSCVSVINLLKIYKNDNEEN